MENVGYDERNAFKGMGTLSFVIYFYFTRVVLTLLLGLLIKITNKKFLGKQL